jgi:hypothetical protein
MHIHDIHIYIYIYIYITMHCLRWPLLPKLHVSAIWQRFDSDLGCDLEGRRFWRDWGHIGTNLGQIFSQSRKGDSWTAPSCFDWISAYLWVGRAGMSGQMGVMFDVKVFSTVPHRSSLLPHWLPAGSPQAPHRLPTGAPLVPTGAPLVPTGSPLVRPVVRHFNYVYM